MLLRGAHGSYAKQIWSIRLAALQALTTTMNEWSAGNCASSQQRLLTGVVCMETVFRASFPIECQSYIQRQLLLFRPFRSTTRIHERTQEQFTYLYFRVPIVFKLAIRLPCCLANNFHFLSRLLKVKLRVLQNSREKKIGQILSW